MIILTALYLAIKNSYDDFWNEVTSEDIERLTEYDKLW